MAVSFIRCLNSGLTISGAGFSIPVVKVVVSGSGAFAQIMPEVYDHCVGMTAITSCLWGSHNLFPEVPAGTYGDNNGFKLQIVRWTDNYWGTYGIDQCLLYYKNSLVGRTKLRSGSAVEVDPMCIYVDESNHIYTVPSNQGSSLCLDTNDTSNMPGWTNIDNKYVATIIPSAYTHETHVYGGDLTLTAENITDDISNEIDPNDVDPYAPGGASTTGGGTGDFDGTGDDITIPSLPTLSSVDTNFITLFNPSIQELQSLASYMWTGGFDLATFKKLFADPMDCILGLSIVPVAVPNGGSKEVSVGNVSTGVTMNYAASQYVELDCGALNVNEYWGAYLDYDPYTKAELYLPYIGTHPLSVDDIMGKTVRVVYHIDILSGACTAFVKCGGSVLYEFIGQCSSSIPITGNDWTNVINGVLSVAGAIGSMVATGGATAPMAAGVVASTVTNSMKPNVEKSGSMSGTGGMLAVQTPYLILTRPNQARPKQQNHYTGYPSFITSELDSLSGYTEIEKIHLDGIPGTDEEIREIELLLKSGVIL